MINPIIWDRWSGSLQYSWGDGTICTLPSNPATSPYIPARGDEFWQSCVGESIFNLNFYSEHICAFLVLQSHITESSRGPERRLGRKQDLQDTRPDVLFAPAQIATGHRRPGPKALDSSRKVRGGACDPQYAFHDQDTREVEVDLASPP